MSETGIFTLFLLFQSCTYAELRSNSTDMFCIHDIRSNWSVYLNVLDTLKVDLIKKFSKTSFASIIMTSSNWI